MQDGEENIKAGAGFYQINVDLSAMSYSLEKVNYISIIGDFNDWAGDVDLTYKKGEWRMGGQQREDRQDRHSEVPYESRLGHLLGVANGDGNNFQNLTQNNGINLNVEAGTYDFKLYISCEGKNHVVITKK